MLDRILDHRERHQIRKARQQKQALRYGAIILVVGMVFLAVGAVMESASPAEKPKASEVVPAKSEDRPAPAEESSEQYIQEFTSKQEKYCLNMGQAAGLTEPQLTEQIETCLVETANWSMEDFE